MSTGEFKQDSIAKWLQLEGPIMINKQIEYKLTKPVIGGTGIAAGMRGIGAGAFKVFIQEPNGICLYVIELA